MERIGTLIKMTPKFLRDVQKHLMTSSRAGTGDQSFKEVGKGRKV